MFVLKVRTANAAFADYPGEELARILRDVAELLANGVAHGTVLDVNGNRAGEWKLS